MGPSLSLQDLLDLFLWYFVFLLSTVFHEAAHAWSAHKMGDDTAYREGQVTLNPIPHVRREPVGALILPIASFFMGGWMIGWASTPYNYDWAYTHPKKAAVMSIAGPAANFILLIFSALLIHTGIWLGYFYSPDSINISSIVAAYDSEFLSLVARLISIMFSLNLILFIFNLIPLPPLDGSGILPLYLSDDNGRKYMDAVRSSIFSVIGFLIAWRLFDLIYWKIFLAVINILYPGSDYQ